MKKLFALIIVALPLGSFASIVTFQCKSQELPGIHKFDALGVVSIDEYNKVEGVISIQTQKAQEAQSTQVFEEIKIEGTRQHFNTGEGTANAFDELTLFTNQGYIKSMNLLLNFKADVASQVFTIDNFLYRSNCFVVNSEK